MDPLFWGAAALAVLVIGVSKGGLGTGLGALGTPIMALVMPPLMAAAILLPVLVVMDVVNVYIHRKNMDFRLFWQFIPSCAVGIGIGWILADYTSDNAIRLIIGCVSVGFSLDYWLFKRANAEAWQPPRLLTRISGALCGFTSFVAHAGGPPFQIFILPQKLPKELIVGTGAIIFAAVNALKIPPYLFLGQFSVENLTIALLLLPLAPLGVIAGAWLLHRIPVDLFYRISYATMFVVGLRLIWVGGVGLFN